MRSQPRQEIRYPFATHEMPSGLGGVFPVRIIEDLGDNVVVENCYKYDGWLGQKYTIAKSTLTKKV